VPLPSLADDDVLFSGTHEPSPPLFNQTYLLSPPSFRFIPSCSLSPPFSFRSTLTHPAFMELFPGSRGGLTIEELLRLSAAAHADRGQRLWNSAPRPPVPAGHSSGRYDVFFRSCSISFPDRAIPVSGLGPHPLTFPFSLAYPFPRPLSLPPPPTC